MRARWGQQARVVSGAIGAVAMLLVGAPAAYAQFSIESPSVTPSSTDAGANANVAIGFDVGDPGADLRDLTIHLPPGLIGNPEATPKCTEAQLNADACPPDSDVGDVTNEINVFLVPNVPVPLTVNGNLFNMVPQPGEPARFGIRLEPLVGDPIVIQSPAALRPSDLGLDTILTDLPNQAVLLGPVEVPIDITRVELVLAGQAGSPPQGFIRLPTSCGTHTVGFDATSHGEDHATAQAAFDTANCAALPFTPEFAAHVKQPSSTAAVELTTRISQTIEEAGLRRAQVTLPVDLYGNAAATAVSCSEAEFQAGSCPATTIIGSASAGSPLLSEALTGPVALVGVPGQLPQIGIDLRGPLALKLKGSLGITSPNKVIFDGLPDIPIADFELTFAGGDGGLTLANRNLCEPPPLVFTVDFESHSGAATTVTPTATTECGAGGNGNQGDRRRKPRARIAVARQSSEKPVMAVRITAGSKKLRSATVKLPRQLQAAHGKRFKRNVDPDGALKLKAKRRELSLRAPKAVGSMSAKLTKGSLRAGKGLSRKSKLRFRVVVRDAAGKATRLTVRGK